MVLCARSQMSSRPSPVAEAKMVALLGDHATSLTGSALGCVSEAGWSARRKRRARHEMVRVANGAHCTLALVERRNRQTSPPSQDFARVGGKGASHAERDLEHLEHLECSHWTD